MTGHKTLTAHQEYLMKERESVKDDRRRAIMYNPPSLIDDNKKIYYIKPEQENISKIHNQLLNALNSMLFVSTTP